MKKWIWTACSIIVIIGFFYVVTSSAKKFSYQITVNCTPTAVTRKVIHKDKWQLWWPGQKMNDTFYTYKKLKYRVDKILLDGAEITIFNNGDSVKSFLQFTGYGNDSAQFRWTSTYDLSNNPYERLTQYFQAKKINDKVISLLQNIGRKFNDPVNIYGMKIKEQRVTDSSLISLKNTFNHYPTTQEVYGMIDSIKTYIKNANGEINNYPMLNIHKTGPSIYETMVAVPTKKDLPSKGKFQMKKMVLGNILMAEVKGGVQTIIKGEKELTNYVHDYHKLSPAISFQSLVTNRLLEPDSSKWITKLYYPVFQ